MHDLQTIIARNAEKHVGNYCKSMQKMTPERDERFKDILDEMQLKIADQGEVWQEDMVEPIEYEFRDGFIPFTQGGYVGSTMFAGSIDLSYVPKPFWEYMERMQKQCERHFYLEQVCADLSWEEQEAITDAEVRAYMEKLLHHNDYGEDDDAYEYYDFESEYLADCSPIVFSRLYYYKTDGEEYMVYKLCGNTETPYYREAYDDVLYSKTIPLNDNAEKELMKACTEALEVL